MLTVESYATDSGESFDIEIAPAPADGKRYPVVVLIHGNLGLANPFGPQLRDFTQEIAKLNYLAALPAYYPSGQSNLRDTNIDSHMPALAAAIKHLRRRSDADSARLGLVGFSLGGGIAMSFITASPAGTVDVFADFYGYVAPLLSAGVAKFPPTIIFHNKNDGLFVPPAQNSVPLADALAASTPKIEHEYHEYDEVWAEGFNHAFEPGKAADTASRSLSKAWLTKHMPPP
jgi:carboxymethylenebutenolidase